MNKEYIKVDNVSISYGKYRALNKISFECRDGEFISIVGRSGSGKTTFLNALAGFVPYEGYIKMPKSIGYVFQQFALFPWMTVEKNIAFGLGYMSRLECKKRVDEMLKQVDMIDFKKRYPNQLSGGQVQRVALARSLAPNPDVLLMDEPYGSLDHHTRDKMQDWLLSIWKESRKTILFVTHYVEEAIYLSDRIIIIRDKKSVQNVQVPFSRPRTNELRFSERFLDMKLQILNFMENNN